MYDFDNPFFKRLRKNDTPENRNKQGGFVLVQELERFFPQLDQPSATNTSPEVAIRAALFDGADAIGVVDTKYKYESWGGTRKEPRITGNLGSIRNLSKADDFLVMERNLLDPFFYRLTLHRAGTSAHKALLDSVGTRRWGAVDIMKPPLGEQEVLASELDQEKHENLPLQLFDNEAAITESLIKKIARSKAFSRRLLPIYDFRCAVCGNGYASHKTWEAEAAHIVPRGLKGADDARNGIVLCKSHHWAFDQGLFGIRPNLTLVIRSTAAIDPRNSQLLPFDGAKVRLPKATDPQPAAEALAWHLKHIAQID